MSRAWKLIRNVSKVLIWGTIGALFFFSLAKKIHTSNKLTRSGFEVRNDNFSGYLPKPEKELTSDEEPESIRARFILSGANCPLFYHPKTAQLLNGDYEVICWRGDDRMGPHIQYHRNSVGRLTVVYAGRFDEDRPEGKYIRWNEAGEKVEVGFQRSGPWSAGPGILAF